MFDRYTLIEHSPWCASQYTLIEQSTWIDNCEYTLIKQSKYQFILKHKSDA